MNRTKRIVAAILAIVMCAVLFAGCGTKTESAKTGVEDGVLTVAMECAYAPYNWTQQVDFAGPYLYASIVCMTKQNSKYANATSLADLAGAKCTSQLGTIWYTTCLPQINGALIQTAQETAPSMLMALETGAVDFICTDMPTAQGALIAYSDLKILNLPENAFKVDEGDINIGISVKKGNTELKDKINSALAGMTADDFNKIMNEATKIQPLSK